MLDRILVAVVVGLVVGYAVARAHAWYWRLRLGWLHLKEPFSKRRMRRASDSLNAKMEELKQAIEAKDTEKPSDTGGGS